MNKANLNGITSILILQKKPVPILFSLSILHVDISFDNKLYISFLFIGYYLLD